MFSSITHHPSFAARCTPWHSFRRLSTLPNNPHIFHFPTSQGFEVLSFLPRDPPNLNLSIGRTSQIPPTPSTFSENPKFLPILHQVLAQYAVSDPQLKGQAVAFAASNSVLFSKISRGHLDQQAHKSSRGTRGDGLNVSGHGGWVHVSDLRCPPDYGRIAWPEDIFGSLEIDSNGEFVGGEEGSTPSSMGRYQPNNTYRIVTSQGIINLSDFLRGKLIDRLNELEQLQLEQSHV